MSTGRVRLKDWRSPPSPEDQGRAFYTTSDGLRAHFDGSIRMWVYERLDTVLNRYVQTGSTRYFQPYF
ncbi:MAG: hypothetical protein EPN36_03395 [Rhodanobacteraceae bacterium]|nr:MAG: hypothetical protein EPN36_03395 [Rhodanobacteraceae bacterium]